MKESLNRPMQFIKALRKVKELIGVTCEVDTHTIYGNKYAQKDGSVLTVYLDIKNPSLHSSFFITLHELFGSYILLADISGNTENYFSVQVNTMYIQNESVEEN